MHRGNVDVTDASDANPETLQFDTLGWKILLVHIAGAPPKTNSAAAQFIQQHSPDIVVFGHSHQACVAKHGDILYVNPGAAGVMQCCHMHTLQQM